MDLSRIEAAVREILLAIGEDPDRDGLCHTPARIVTLSEGLYSRNLTLGQGIFGGRSDVYDARLRTTTTDANGVPSLSSPGGSLTAELTHVVYTRDASGQTRLYIDGIERASGHAGGTLATWDATFRLALGNELGAERPQLGTYHLVAVYDRALASAEVGHNFSAGPDGDADPPEPPSAPGVPTGLQATATSSSSITISWQSVADATGYELRQSTDESAWTTISGVTSPYQHAGRSAETTHFYQVRAVNAVGSSDWGATVSATTPAAPGGDSSTYLRASRGGSTGYWHGAT